MAAPPELRPAGIDALKARQREHADRAFARPAGFEGNRFHDHFRALPFERLKELLDARGVDLTGRRVLVASCGSGIDLHYLRRHYEARWLATDLSEAAVRAVARAFPDVETRVEDNEALSLPDGSVDYAFVAGALHHLPRPLVGLYELLRVARCGVVGIEPNDAWLPRLFTRLGLATEVEPMGNYVYRLGRHDVRRVAGSLFLPWEARACFAVHRVARSRAEFALLRASNAVANRVAPGQGNTLVFFVGRGDGG